jgi:uncharacterized Zn finger protein (UPF0148 family)
MIAFVSGYSDTNLIHYCPSCASPVFMCHADGTGTCGGCGLRFAVIEAESEDDE